MFTSADTPMRVVKGDAAWQTRWRAAWDVMDFDERWFVMATIRSVRYDKDVDRPHVSWNGDIICACPYEHPVWDASILVHEGEHISQLLQHGSRAAFYDECAAYRVQTAFLAKHGAIGTAESLTRYAAIVYGCK